MTQTPLLLKSLRGEATVQAPTWIMRQAGRYLPEYRETRAKAGDFLTLCYTPDLACEVTLQPLRRFDLDASIIFSDILVIPQALGRKLWFEAGEGPKLTPIESADEIKALETSQIKERLSAVYEAVSMTRSKLDPKVTLIGFCGAPWTLATYMIEGGGSKDHVMTRAFAYQNPDVFSALLDVLVEACAEHLLLQIASGAQVVQIFDSWAGSLTAHGFHDWCIAPIAKIVAKVRAGAPAVPIIGFPRGAGQQLPDFVSGTMVDAVGLDTSMAPGWVNRVLPSSVPVQGNVDPAILMSDADQVRRAVYHVRKSFRGRPHILNLGHGIPQTADIALVDAFVAAAKLPLGDLMQQVKNA